MPQLIECVPNFSEGRDLSVIRRITDVVEAVEGVTLLDVDPGRATNRTVVTFVGAPEDVVEAAVQAAARAVELIDMRRHRGEHPRFGALDEERGGGNQQHEDEEQQRSATLPPHQRALKIDLEFRCDGH